MGEEYKPEDYEDIDQLSKRSKLQKSWWYNQTRLKKCPHYKCGKYLRFRPSEIDKWLAEKYGR